MRDFGVDKSGVMKTLRHVACYYNMFGLYIYLFFLRIRFEREALPFIKTGHVRNFLLKRQ